VTRETKKSPWLVRKPRSEPATERLFCFPYAGASSAVYNAWHGGIASHVEVCVIEPPGHFGRPRDALIVSVPEFVEQVTRELEPYLDLPFSLFGHSLGALLAFETARSIRRSFGLEPKQLFASAARAPHWIGGGVNRWSLPASQDELVVQIERLYGPLEPALKASPALLESVVAIMRADLTMIEQYRHTIEPRLRCPLLALGGLGDRGVPRSQLEEWQLHTSGRFDVRWFEAGHLFLRTRGPELRSVVRDVLCGATHEAASCSA
jgi:surfactin synthase thioesterase subunit